MSLESLASGMNEMKSTRGDGGNTMRFDPDKRMDTNDNQTSFTDNHESGFDPDKRMDTNDNRMSISDNETKFDPDKRFDNQKNDMDGEQKHPVEKETDAKQLTEKKGGSYGEVFIEGEGDKYEVHHMPADSASNLERNDGPAIKMEKEDHRQTASCGSSKEAREYRAAQKELIEQGKFREALQMDIDDIHEKFGDKYDDAISEMLEYVDNLEAEGKIDE